MLHDDSSPIVSRRIIIMIIIITILLRPPPMPLKPPMLIPPLNDDPCLCIIWRCNGLCYWINSWSVRCPIFRRSVSLKGHLYNRNEPLFKRSISIKENRICFGWNLRFHHSICAMLGFLCRSGKRKVAQLGVGRILCFGQLANFPERGHWELKSKYIL